MALRKTNGYTECFSKEIYKVMFPAVEKKRHMYQHDNMLSEFHNCGRNDEFRYTTILFFRDVQYDKGDIK